MSYNMNTSAPFSSRALGPDVIEVFLALLIISFSIGSP